MKITAIDTALLAVPTPRPMALQYPEHKLVVAQVLTDQGLRGLGYSLVFNGGGAEAVLTYLETRLKPALLGEDATQVERLWEKMFRADMGVRKQGVAAYALSALDIGLWDIVGKSAGLPLSKLWGAASERVGAYGSGGWAKYSVEDLVAEAEKYAALGCIFQCMLHIGLVETEDDDLNALFGLFDSLEQRRSTIRRLGYKLQSFLTLNLPDSTRTRGPIPELDALWPTALARHVC